MVPIESCSLPELASAVNAWCREQRISPSSGQAAEDLSERTLRFYRTIGLLDAPESGGGRGYREKHFLQLAAVRLLQARGLPLRRIRELLQNRSLQDLRQIQDQGLAVLAQVEPFVAVWPPPTEPESWRMIPITGDFLLLARGSSEPPAETIAKIRQLLNP
jgi:DNA-binding transcriptional MerR regulator